MEGHGMPNRETKRDLRGRIWRLAVAGAAGGLLLAPSAWAQPVSRVTAASIAVEDEVIEEERADAAAAATDMEIRLTKQIMLLQRQLNQLTTRLDAVEARTAE